MIRYRPFASPPTVVGLAEPLPRALLAILIAGCVAVATPAALAQTTWYVDDNAPADPGPGDPTISDPAEDGSAEHPFDAIQEGIDAAVDGDTVLVQDGTYAGAGNKDLDYGGKAITVRSANGPETCVIDCENDGRGVYFDGGETAASILEGVTIRNEMSATTHPARATAAVSTATAAARRSAIALLRRITPDRRRRHLLRRWHAAISGCLVKNNWVGSILLGGGNGGGIHCLRGHPQLQIAQSVTTGVAIWEAESPAMQAVRQL